MSEQRSRSYLARGIDNALQYDPKESLEALAATDSARCDAMILAAEAEEGLTFQGGTLAIALLRNGVELAIEMNAYFLNARGEWVTKTNSRVHDVDVVLTAPAIAELRRIGRVAFDLEKPAQSTTRPSAPQQ